MESSALLARAELARSELGEVESSAKLDEVVSSARPSSARWRAAMPLAQAAHARKAVVAARAGATERHKAFFVDKESESVRRTMSGSRLLWPRDSSP